jgi:hypothetical protein
MDREMDVKGECDAIGILIEIRSLQIHQKFSPHALPHLRAWQWAWHIELPSLKAM